MSDAQHYKMSDSEVTLELLESSDEKIHVRKMLDFLRCGLKDPRERAESSITYHLEEGDIIFDYEDTFDASNFDRQFLVVTNGDLVYAAARIYASSRKLANDFWDCSDKRRLTNHANSEERLLDFAIATKRYAFPMVWETLVERVNDNYLNIGEINHEYMAALYAADVENYLHYNVAYGEGPTRSSIEPAAYQFVYLLNGKIPSNMGFLVKFFTTLKITSKDFREFFENERELTLGEHPSKTED